MLAEVGITRVANVSGLDVIGLPVVMVVRPNSRLTAVSNGKGIDLDAARVSGIMEGVEAYHAESIDGPLRLASWNEMRRRLPSIDLERLPRLATSSFHEHAPTLWIEGTDLLSGSPCWVPFELVHTRYVLPALPGTGFFPANTNGLGSGNSLVEAVIHGIAELVEHDATALWELSGENHRAATRVDLTTIDDETCRSIVDRFRRAGVDVAVWETTTDIGVPSFLCRVADAAPAEAQSCGPADGMGCHPVRSVALARALLEAAQSRLTEIAASRDDRTRSDYARFTDAHDRARLCLSLAGADAGRRFGEAPTHECDHLDEDLSWLLGRLDAVGIRQVVAVDLTRPELSVPVVRMVIPGLEGMGFETAGRVEYVPGARALRRAGGATC